MTQAKTPTLSLGERWDYFIAAQIEQGHYSTANEVVRDALRLMEERQDATAGLRAALQEGEDSGDGGPMDAAMIKAEVLGEMGHIG
ncbi:MAG: antitoxin ParD1/3/4 [Phenylobacterium sp.]|jgi:antitoxin ParD1/3/4